MAEAIILKFVKNTGTKHEDLIINGYKYKWCRNNKDNTSNYKCRVKNPTRVSRDMDLKFYMKLIKIYAVGFIRFL